MTRFPPFVYGTTRLGDESIPRADRIEVARKAMREVGFLHTSDQYGTAMDVLREAADGAMPPVIVKIGWESIDQIRSQVLSQNERLGIARTAVGQLCPGGAFAESIQAGGGEEALALREEGIVDRFVIETWPWTSAVPLAALERDTLGKTVDALIFYLNPLQRFVTNELWDLVRERGTPVVSMRTTCGGSLERLKSGEGYLASRARELTPVYARSGCATWAEFCARFLVGYGNVLTTVGATARPENLDELIESTRAPSPLAPEIHAEIEALQRRWSDEHDRHAAPWSM